MKSPNVHLTLKRVPNLQTILTKRCLWSVCSLLRLPPSPMLPLRSTLWFHLILIVTIIILLHKHRWWQRRRWVKTTSGLDSYSSTLVLGTFWSSQSMKSSAKNFIIIVLVMISVDDLNNAPWIEGMYFLAAAIYAATILLYWVLRKRCEHFSLIFQR